MAAAAFLIRDAGLKGHDVIILEESDKVGGSLDANGTPETGYIMRGGRMIESKYLCTFDLFSSIPALDNRQSVTEEIFAWNRIMKTASRSRLFRGGKSVDAPLFGLNEKQLLTIERLEIEPELVLGRTSIADQFDADFFETDFWFMWCIITSQFLPRSKGDRPAVLPPRSKNLAFVGQFCEIDDDVVFTVEYSIRSAQTAVYALLGIDREPPPVYKGTHDLKILAEAYRTLHQ